MTMRHETCASIITKNPGLWIHAIQDLILLDIEFCMGTIDPESYESQLLCKKKYHDHIDFGPKIANSCWILFILDLVQIQFTASC